MEVSLESGGHILGRTAGKYIKSEAEIR